MLIVGLPISIGVTAALFKYNSVEAGERLAQQTLGESDGVVRITPYSAIDIAYEHDGSMSVQASRNGAGNSAVRRDPRLVILSDILPSNTKWTPEPFTAELVLEGGGTAAVTELDLADPLTRGIIDLAFGAAPTGRNEVAVTEDLAKEFGFLDSDHQLAAGASLGLGNGQSLRVVGVTEPDRRTASGNTAQIVMAPGSIPQAGNRIPTSFLVDLPESERSDVQELITSLAAGGVALMPRDALLNPDVWDVRGEAQSTSDVRALAVGAIVVLGGLVEVLLIVGAVFAIGARRSVRHLGLIAANGGTRADARKHLIAPGLLIGLSAATLGSVVGIGLFFGLAPVYEHASGEYLLRGVDWLSVAVIAIMGSLTAVLAALPPAFAASRMDPIEAMAGGYATIGSDRSSKSRLTRWRIASVCLALSLLVVAGEWTAREFAAEPLGGRPPSLAPVVLGAGGVLLLMIGAFGSASALAAIGSRSADPLWLSARIAVRDAARNRLRTAAAAGAIGLVVAASIFVSAGATAAVMHGQQDPQAPTRSVVVYLGGADRSTPSIKSVDKTLREVLGPVEVSTAYRVHPGGAAESTLVMPSSGGIPTEVRAVNEATLNALVGRLTQHGLQVFRAGGVVTTEFRSDESNDVALAISDRDGHTTELETRSVAWERDDGGAGLGDFSTAWISLRTAKKLGLRVSPTGVLADAHKVITRDQVDRLALRGISAYAPDTDTDLLPVIAKVALLAAGLLTLLVAGVAVALTSFERRDDASTMAAMGASPLHRRTISAMQGGYLGLLGLLLGVLVGLPGALSLGQIDGVRGTAVPFSAAALLALPLLTVILGFLVVPRQLSLTRRAD